MPKQPVKVIVRARPTNKFASSNLDIDETRGKVTVRIPKDASQGIVNHQQETWGFQFDKVLLNASQEVIFDICARDIVQSLLEGYSGTIMCYGQTGAGKTFSMSGSMQDYKYRGIIPRAITMLYQEIQSRYDQQITVSVSYLEIYNELITDLLALAFTPENQPNLRIQEDQRGQVMVVGLMQKVCSNEEECLQMMFEGDTNRTIAQHKLNKASSRSHGIFTLHLQMRSRVESSEKVIYSKLNLVDLAGSERTKKSGSEGQLLIEAQFINKSLSYLEQVVVSLQEKAREHIPYRQCKLTNYLKDSIGGNCKTIMVANIWPEADHLEETISTLKFASRMMKVCNEATINVSLDPTVLLKKYEKEIKELKQELAMHDTLANRGRITYDPFTPEQQYEQQKIAQQFLDSEIEDIEIESLRQVKELFFQFKNLYRNLKNDIQNNQYIPSTEQQPTTGAQAKKAASGKQIEAVGIEENKYGFGRGLAPKDAKPTAQQMDSLVVVPKDEKIDETLEKSQKAQQSLEQSEVLNQQKIELEQKRQRLVNVDRNQVYVDFKEKEGMEYNNAIIKNIKDLREKKNQIKELTYLANKKRDEIENLKDSLQRKQDGKNQEEIQQGIIDEEEFEIIKEMKQAKKEYKQYADQIKADKSASIIIEQNISRSKQQLLIEFEKWFRVKYGLSIHDLDNPLINAKSEVDKSEEDFNDGIDKDAAIYLNAKTKVGKLQKARKLEKYK